MRRFRRWRKRAAALALLPAVVLITTASNSTAAERTWANIEPGQGAVAYGKPVTLRGRFPDAPNATIEIQQRPNGVERFRGVTRTRTDARGRYETRVKPRSTASWRARIANPQRYRAARADATVTSGREVDTQTGSRRVTVRSITRARVGDKHTLVGRSVKVRGRVLPAGSRRVVVRAGGRKVKTRAGGDGRFAVRWTPPSTGSYRVAARAAGNRKAGASGDRAGEVTAYRTAPASWYGPGFYGNRTACGQTLSQSTLGVAHKTMACGTKLTLRYRGRSVKVEVIDRGPYSGDREFDLTYATKQRLRFPSTGTVWTSR